MVIYNILKIIIKLFSLALFLGAIALVIYLLWQGTDWTALIGEIWFAHSSDSLNLAQVIVERYIYHPLWFDVAVPYVLQQPAYLVLPATLLVTGIFAYVANKILWN